MKLPTPSFPDMDGIRAYLTNLVKALSYELDKKADRNAATGSVLLASPDGSVYSVGVTDAGVITVTKVQG